MPVEFKEIAHSGGKVTFSIKSNESGGVSYQIKIQSSRPVPFVWIAVYALPQGIPVARLNLGGIGHVPDPPPIPGCFQVFIASDSEGKFGHTCQQCKGYWRSGPWPNVCPYCGNNDQSHEFLSMAQRQYVHHYCDVLRTALESGQDGDVVIDMDLVADAVGKEVDKPEFYISEQSQQRKFTCGACGEFNDILGRFCYCSVCGTRNDLMDFEEITVPRIRERINTGSTPEDCVRDAVASFDSFMAQLSKQLIAFILMTERRKNRLSKRFHNLKEVSETFREYFDIDMCSGLKSSEIEFVARMFHRRHVYEHNGGEVDQKYLDDTGDTTVCLKQHIHETQENAHKLLNYLVKIVRNCHAAFHGLLPPIHEPIKAFEDRKAHMGKFGGA